jgi:hypothetical protein
MIRRYGHFAIILLLLFCSLLKANAQSNNLIAARKKLILLIDLSSPKTDIDSILKRAGIANVNVQALIEGDYSVIIKNGWTAGRRQKFIIQFNRPINELKANPQSSPYNITSVAITDGENHGYPKAIYGINKFSSPSVYELPSGLTRFFLPGYLTARRVFLSGSFNDWSTLKGVMSKTINGWVIDLKLQPGPYEYKFIADSQWLTDPGNLLQANDGGGNINSLYFKYNYTFKLAGFALAHKIALAGSFNNENGNELSLEKKGDTWVLPMYLHDGMYYYHFIVDGKWINDPANPNKHTDDKGNISSVINLGETIYFKLNGYANAKNVFVAGNFNNWDPGKIRLKKSGDAWLAPVILSPGNYQYKFIVDGDWITDPLNPCHAVEGKQYNSFLAVNPTHTFKLNGHNSANVVHLAGSFNSWNTNQYLLGHIADGWSISLYLKPGKYLYKFIADDQWLLDPGNKLWEQNQYNTGNSVLWIDPAPL